MSAMRFDALSAIGGRPLGLLSAAALAVLSACSPATGPMGRPVNPSALEGIPDEYLAPPLHVSPQGIVTIGPEDLGGSVLSYIQRIAEAHEAITAGRIRRIEITGECSSACTMWLSVACVRADAVLGFHGAFSYYTGQSDPWADVVTRKFYPPLIAEADRRWSQSRDLTKVSARYLIQMGATPCP